MGQESWSPPSIILSAEVGRRLFPEFFTGKTEAVAASRGEEIRTKYRPPRTKCVRLGDLSRRWTERGALRDRGVPSPRRSWRGSRARDGAMGHRVRSRRRHLPCEPG